MSALDKAYDILYTAALVVIAVNILMCLIKTILGPRIADRMVTVNMISTLVIAAIAVLALKLGENYLLDVCLVYALLGFISVIVLTKVYMGIHIQREAEKKAKEEKAHDA